MGGEEVGEAGGEGRERTGEGEEAKGYNAVWSRTKFIEVSFRKSS